MPRFYPYKIESKLVSAIWGGDALATRYGKTGQESSTTGESWECWANNVVLNGENAGQSINQIWANAGPAFLGLVPTVSKTQFPLLTKFIDARESLSVQVHPHDDYAQKVENQANGKTECWVILEALPDAEIVLGFSQDTRESEVRRRCKDGTLGDILRRIKVKAGDVYFLPAGTVHAIGAGIVLFETQQTSELTYRLFDWNRKDAAGLARELHIDKAAAVLNYACETRGAVEPLAYRMDGVDRRLLIADERFGVEEVRVALSARFFTESVCTIVTACETPVVIRTLDEAVELAAWSTAILPAGIPRVEIVAAQPTSVYLVTPPGAFGRVRSRLELIGYDSQQREAFLAQFAMQAATV